MAFITDLDVDIDTRQYDNFYQDERANYVCTLNSNCGLGRNQFRLALHRHAVIESICSKSPQRSLV